MPPVLVDSNSIIAARFSRDQSHKRATEITEAFDRGDLATGHVPSNALEEILNYVNERGSHGEAVATLDKLQKSNGCKIVYTQKSDFDVRKSFALSDQSESFGF